MIGSQRRMFRHRLGSLLEGEAIDYCCIGRDDGVGSMSVAWALTERALLVWIGPPKGSPKAFRVPWESLEQITITPGPRPSSKNRRDRRFLRWFLSTTLRAEGGQVRVAGDGETSEAVDGWLGFDGTVDPSVIEALKERTETAGGTVLDIRELLGR